MFCAESELEALKFELEEARSGIDPRPELLALLWLRGWENIEGWRFVGKTTQGLKCEIAPHLGGLGARVKVFYKNGNIKKDQYFNAIADALAWVKENTEWIQP